MIIIKSIMIIFYIFQLILGPLLLASGEKDHICSTKKEFLMLWLIPYYWIVHAVYKSIKSFIEEYKKLD